MASEQQVTLFLRPFFDSNGLLVAHERRARDRRSFRNKSSFPMFEQSGGVVHSNRRRVVERRVRKIQQTSQVTIGPFAVGFLRHKTFLCEVTPESACCVGRSKENNVLVQSDAVSRLHACIESRKDGVYLIDKSRNGTYVCNDQNGKVRVIRDVEYKLESDALISFGSPLQSRKENQDVYVFCLLEQP